jgi:uncharacterized protein YkwD
VPSSYYSESTLGYLLSAPDPVAGTQQLFDCVVLGSEDHFLSLDAGCEGQQVLGSAGYSYTASLDYSVQLYRCYLWRGSHGDHFVSTDPGCEGQTSEGSLGYALTTPMVPVSLPPAASQPVHHQPPTVVDTHVPPAPVSNPGPAIPTSGTTSDPRGGSAGTGCAITPDQAQGEAYLLSLLNQHRADAGVAPLQLNETLSLASRAHSCDMAQQNTLSHTGSDGSSPWQRIQATGTTYTTAGENCGQAGGYALTDAINVIDNSMMAEGPGGGHHDAIVNSNYTQVGIGIIVDSQGQTWVTEDFVG